MRSRLACILILAFFFLILITPVLAQDGKTIDQIAAEQEIPIAQQIGNFYTWAVGISALVALGILVYAGLAYTVAGGNASRQSDAKQWIWNALIGLGLLFGSYIILNTINPDLTKLQNIDLSQVKVGQATKAAGEAKSLDLAQLIGNFYSWALGIGGLVALGIIIFAGILYTISPGNSSRQSDAKIWIGSAIVGLVLLFGSYAVLNTVNPDLTKLVSLEDSLKKIEPSLPPAPLKEADLSGLISNFYAWALGIGGVVALGILIFGGILYTTSAGNASRQEEAKTWLLGAIIGLLLLFGSYAVLNTINPDLTRLANLKDMLSGSGGQITSEKGGGPQGREAISLSELTNKQLGRKDLASTGAFESWNCGGPGGGGNLYSGACSLGDRPDNCFELQRNGVDCPSPVFISFLDLIGAPPGLLKVPVPTKVLAPFLPKFGFTLSSVKYDGGNCQLPLNPVLVDNIAELKRRVPECTASERCFVQPATTACTTESVNNDRGHPIHSHLELRAVDLVTSGKNRGLDSPPKEWEEKDRAILGFLEQSYCVENLIAPSRFGSLCVEKGQKGVECTGVKDARGNEEEIIHYDVRPEADCKYAQKYAEEIDFEKLAQGAGGAGAVTTGESGGTGEEIGTETAEKEEKKPGEKVPLGIAEQIGKFYQWALGIGGLIALGVLIFGGILYTISAGNASRQEDAKGWLLGAVMGILLLFGSFLILNTVNPELTKLKDLELIVNKAARKVEFVNFQVVENIIGFKKDLFDLLQKTDSVNAMSWLWMVSCESAGTYNPAIENHSSNVPDPDGACGLFQMDCGCNGSSPYDCGKGDVNTQVSNAIALFHERGPGYWDAADGTCGDGYNGHSILK